MFPNWMRNIPKNSIKMVRCGEGHPPKDKRADAEAYEACIFENIIIITY